MSCVAAVSGGGLYAHYENPVVSHRNMRNAADTRKQRIDRRSAKCYTPIMSPTVFREKSYRFHFFSLEEERMHIHVVTPAGKAKFWIEPEIALALSQGIPIHELTLIETIVKEHRDEIESAWREHFQS